MESYLNSLPEVMPEVVPDGQGSGPPIILRADMEESAMEVLVEAGVSYLLLDRADEANHLWSDLRVRRSPEALVGRAALALRAGDGEHARELVERLLPEHRERISSDLREWIRGIASSEATTVFADAERRWYEECLAVLEEIPGITIPVPRPGA